MKVPMQPKVTATRKTIGSGSLNLNPQQQLNRLLGSQKETAAKSTNPDLVVPTQIPISPLEDISDHLDRLPLQACVELTCRLLTSISSLPTGAARPRPVLKTVILFVAEYGSTP